jgi:hypothetical protein
MKPRTMVVFKTREEAEAAPVIGGKPYEVTRGGKRYFVWARNAMDSRAAVSKACGDKVKLVKGRASRVVALANKIAKLSEEDRASINELLRE